MKKLIIISLFAFIFNSCSEDFEPKPLTYSKLLTGENSKSWRLETIQFIEEGRPVGAIPLDNNNCIYDDLYVFYADANKTFIVDEGPSRCSEDDPQIFLQDTWLIVNSNATIEMVIPALIPIKLPYILRDLDENKMIAEIFFDDNQQSYRFVFNAVSQD